MNSDLFGDASELEQLPIQDAEVYFLHHAPLQTSENRLLESLIRETPWRSETVTVWGKTFVQPRLIAWYGDTGKTYSYSGTRLTPLPWTPMLLEIKQVVEHCSKVSFNSVLLNYYRDNMDSMGFHSDDEPELGLKPVIASLSLGAERTIIFKHKTSKLLRPVKVALNSGSLLLMKEDTQQNWKHGIEKETKSVGPRVNLTFRQIFSRAEV